MAGIEDRVRVTGKPVFILFGFFIAAGYWFMNGNPTQNLDSENAVLMGQIAETKSKIKEAEDRLANRNKFFEEMQRLSTTFKMALEYLPRDLDIQDILKKTFLEARSAGVSLSTFTPKEVIAKDFYDEVPIDIKLRGSYSQLVTFLATMSKLSRIVNIQNIEISQPKFVNGIPVMDFQGTLVVYRYKDTK
jgi:type IV pilus assembly protein PilO